MNNNYKIRDLGIEELYVNPDNARFINSDELPDELSAIKELVSLNLDHAINLSKDIASNGLNPNELPIVMQASDENKFLVMDGNRRLTSIKLMTQYRDSIDDLGFSATQKRELLGLKCDIKTIRCVFCEDEDEVNYLLEKLHTSKSGISQVKWEPQAQDRHQLKIGMTTERLAIIEMLNCSKYTSSEAKNILNKKGWLSKLNRFMRKKYLSIFGIVFDKDNNIILYITESEVMKGLSQLVIDLEGTIANDIAQTAEVREKYLNEFPSDKIPDKEKINNPLIIFDINTKEFIKTNIPNEWDSVNDMNNKNSHNKAKKDDGTDKGDSQNNQKKGNNDQDTNGSYQNNGQDSTDKNGKEKENNSSSSFRSTDERTTLIPKDDSIPIKDQRTLDLYNELQIINVSKYVNIVSIAFRSLIEFSINCFLNNKINKWAYNERIPLIEKLEKTLSILESAVGKNQLKTEIPAIYISIDSYKSGGRSDSNSITLLNLLIHNHNYHPTDKDLKSIYNNFRSLLFHIWNNI